MTKESIRSSGGLANHLRFPQGADHKPDDTCACFASHMVFANAIVFAISFAQLALQSADSIASVNL